MVRIEEQEPNTQITTFHNPIIVMKEEENQKGVMKEETIESMKEVETEEVEAEREVLVIIEVEVGTEVKVKEEEVTSTTITAKTVGKMNI